MSLNLRLLLFIFSFISFLIIFRLLKKDKIPVKYSLVWFISSLTLLVVSLFPYSLKEITNFIGFQTTSNLVIGIILALLLFITMVLTIIISNQNKKITLLIQEVSLLDRKSTRLNSSHHQVSRMPSSA